MAPQLRDRWHNRGHSWRMEVRMTEIPSWHITGDWFDNCSCAVACPCTFAQAPDNGFCESVLFWHIRSGHYGDINLDGLSFVRVGRWEGDLWAGKAKGAAGVFIDERADDRQAEALPLIFGGRAGGTGDSASTPVGLLGSTTQHTKALRVVFVAYQTWRPARLRPSRRYSRS